MDTPKPLQPRWLIYDLPDIWVIVEGGTSHTFDGTLEMIEWIKENAYS